jgi:shikimate dehydrogenase
MTVTGKTRVVGVWGYPVKHSLSPVMHNAALAALGLDWTYVPFSVDPININDAVAAIRALDLVGVNITVPLKELVAPLLDRVDPDAARINSVNTIVNNGGALLGYSTDGAGLMWDLSDKGALPERGSSVLVLGAGGSARAVVDVLSKKEFAVTIANRTYARAVSLAADLATDAAVVEWTANALAPAIDRARLIINTTSLGLSADGRISDLPAFPPGCIGQGKVLYDIVYSPPETLLMRIARNGGAVAYNGIGMLVRQGALSLQLWSGLPLERMPLDIMQAAIDKHLT